MGVAFIIGLLAVLTFAAFMLVAGFPLLAVVGFWLIGSLVVTAIVTFTGGRHPR